MEGPLGRKPPTDDRHLKRFSLTAGTMPEIPTPVVIGINWYTAFDRPRDAGRYATFPGPNESWGAVRGGHAVCLKPPALVDNAEWWRFYDQGQEGACVGFAVSRMMTLLNRRRYDARRVYQEALKIDEWPGEADEGTSVRAGCDVARLMGMWRVKPDKVTGPHERDGIQENRWANTTAEVAACLDPASGGKRVLDAGYVLMLNSWNVHYPHLTMIPLDTLARLLWREGGDATVVIDRPNV